MVEGHPSKPIAGNTDSGGGGAGPERGRRNSGAINVWCGNKTRAGEAARQEQATSTKAAKPMQSILPRCVPDKQPTDSSTGWLAGGQDHTTAAIRGLGRRLGERRQRRHPCWTRYINGALAVQVSQLW